MTSGAGRYAPSPTSALHLGNLRTALVAWAMARSTDRQFRLRIEDLDQQRVVAAGDVRQSQIDDLVALGIEFDPPTVIQSERLDVYGTAIMNLGDRVYECFCTRREIAAAASAPHASDGFRPYPGTCRDLTEAERAARRAHRRAALRVRADGARMEVVDQFAGVQTQIVDDFVIRRSDGVWAYQFAVVVDDAAMGVDQIVRGDDLATSMGRHVWLAQALGTPFIGEFAHVPLVVRPDGRRLAKRDGDPGLGDLVAEGWSPEEVLGILACSLGLATPGERVTPSLVIDRFDPDLIPREPWVWDRSGT